ncbi:MAG: ribosome silencing factor [Planctomycetota bacterium]
MSDKSTQTSLSHSPASVAHRIGDIILDKKGLDLVVIEIGRISSLADYLVIATVENSRQLQAIARELQEKMKKEGSPRLGDEGVDQGWWVLLDFGDVIVHLMQQEARDFYAIEALWADGDVVRRSA